MLIHYIWAGHLDSEINQRCCQLGPVSLAHRKQPDIKIIMWVSDAAVATAHDLFKPYKSISVRSIEQTLNSGKLGCINPYVESIKTLWQLMGAQKSYVAQKDLGSFVVMAAYGGYFFDCTTAFTQVEQLLPVDDFKVLGGELSKIQITYAGSTDLMDTDIWAFAASETGHPVFVDTHAAEPPPSVDANKAGHPLFIDTLVAVLKACCKSESSELHWNDNMTGIACDRFRRIIQEHYPYLEQKLDATWTSQHVLWYSQKSGKGGQVLKLSFDGNAIVKYHMALWKRPADTLPAKTQEGYQAYQTLLLQQHDFTAPCSSSSPEAGSSADAGPATSAIPCSSSDTGPATSMASSMTTLGLLPAPTHTDVDSPKIDGPTP